MRWTVMIIWNILITEDANDKHGPKIKCLCFFYLLSGLP